MSLAGLNNISSQQLSIGVAVAATIALVATNATLSDFVINATSAVLCKVSQVTAHPQLPLAITAISSLLNGIKTDNDEANFEKGKIALTVTALSGLYKSYIDADRMDQAEIGIQTLAWSVAGLIALTGIECLDKTRTS